MRKRWFHRALQQANFTVRESVDFEIVDKFRELKITACDQNLNPHELDRRVLLMLNKV
jgi:hypothetical protein